MFVIGRISTTAVHIHTDQTIVYLTIDGETIQTIPEHPFYTEKHG